MIKIKNEKQKSIKNEMGDITPHTTAIKRIIKEHYKRYDPHRFDGLEKIELVQLIQISRSGYTHKYNQFIYQSVKIY